MQYGGEFSFGHVRLGQIDGGGYNAVIVNLGGIGN